ncbi:tRNA-modifying protein YgfZ [Gilliamella sp. Pra-s65]|uniref:tRNA-modifying protein YgfZ n=1 Tax=unclassified Gilliamella TaxID=2685620 RepID=UPI0013656D0F|nr:MULTISPECIES: tRNA-modifying protein YgfZ [unclassified Gilliamella]MWN90506.1 tRNA-modifying protein YgfZ [Gilliamella sp. Pra-s65]MWP73521.1 tRNA-modifying protein YgfZ [Gilliamella sp. Pra-s52]
MSNISSKPTSLADWQLVKVSGDDNRVFLQGQITNDINRLSEHATLYAAHCDSKGRMWSTLLLFQRGNDIYYIERKSVAKRQVAELAKYAVFSKVSIELVQNLNMVGLVDDAIPAAIKAKLIDKSCLTENNITYIKLPLPETRVIMITPESIPNDLNPCSDWLKLDFQAGYPVIDDINMAILLPQACNLQSYDAISFDKGCYCGQEMVARAQFRGANTRGMYVIKGTSNVLPKVGSTLEYKLTGGWREGGLVLAATRLDDKDSICVQVVLNNGIDLNTVFRIYGNDNSRLMF